MNAIIGMSQLTLDSHLNKEQQHLVEVIDNSGQLLLRLINDILDFSKIEAGKFELNLEPVYPSDIFKKNLPIIKDLAAKKNITFKGIKNSDKKVLIDCFLSVDIS